MSEQPTPEGLVHLVCQWLRTEWEENPPPCQKCPMTIESPYGPGTQMCVLRAQELIDIVREGK